jgi:alkyl hydroperoxide reductase subunit AhpF
MLDLLIIGGSAAATAAGIYAARRNLDFKIVSKDFGGEVATSGEIGNWPGMKETNGFELSEKFKEHLESYGVKPELGVLIDKVIVKEDGTFCVTAKKEGETGSAAEKTQVHENGAMKCDYEAKAVIVSTGVHPKPLDIPGEKEFRGKGVTYCTTCDGPLFKDKVTATIGGGNSALESSIMMAGIAKKHYIINKNPQFKGDEVLLDKIAGLDNVEIIYNAMTSEIMGEQFVTGLKYKDVNTNEEKQLDVDGIMVHIGMIPNSDIVPEEVEKNEFGEIVVDMRGETNIPGLYAAGDVTNVPFNQIVIAAGQGASAVLSAIEYINRLEK